MIFQIILASLGNNFIAHCGFNEKLLRHVGLVRLDNLDAVSITQWIGPEVIALSASIIALFILRQTAKSDNKTIESGNHAHPANAENKNNPGNRKTLANLSKAMSLVVLCATGALQPSVLNFVYFAVFLGASTWWACNRKLERCVMKFNFSF